MKNIDFEEKIGLVGIALVLSVLFSWAPWLGYNIIASVFPIPDITWKQATFFTWAGVTLVFWYNS